MYIALRKTKGSFYYSKEVFLSEGSSQASPAELEPPPMEAAAALSPPPIEVKKAENSPEGPSLAPIPRPRKSRVVGLLLKSDVDGPIIKSFKPEEQLEGIPSPRPGSNELFPSCM